jgi:hypothetical protein
MTALRIEMDLTHPSHGRDMVETIVLKPVQDANDLDGKQKSFCIVIPIQSPENSPSIR